MLVKQATWAALLFAVSDTMAQTFTLCDPTKKTCPDNPALSTSTYTHDFVANGADDAVWNTTAGNVTYTSAGAEFTISKAGDAPTIQSNWYIFFGRVSFFLKASPGVGIVSSAILESDDLDEVDLEWLGGPDKASEVQSNYFGKGNTTTFDRGEYHKVDSTQATAHNYTIVWTSSATTWYINDAPIRTLNFADAVGGKNYPQTPMNIRVGNWAGGNSENDPGTIQWAGGVTNFADGPFTMILEKIEVVNDNPGASYTYGDMSGDFSSIKVNAASNSSSQVPPVAPPAASAAPPAASAAPPAASAAPPAASVAPPAASAAPPSAAPPSAAPPAPTASAEPAAPAPPAAGSSEPPQVPAENAGLSTPAAAPTTATAASALAEQESLRPSAVGSAANLDAQAWWRFFLGVAVVGML